MRATVDKWRAAVVRKQRIDLQKLKLQVERDAIEVARLERAHDKRSFQQSLDLQCSETIRRRLASAVSEQRDKADAAERNLRHIRTVTTTNRPMDDTSIPSESAEAVSTAAEAKFKQFVEDKSTMQGQLERLQLALSNIEKERARETSRADREQKRADRYEAKLAKDRDSSKQAHSDLEEAIQAKVAAVARLQEAERKLADIESVTADEVAARERGEKDVADLVRDLNEARETITRNKRSTEEDARNAEQERMRLATALEEVIRDQGTAVNSHRQDSGTLEQAIVERNKALFDRDVAIVKQNEAVGLLHPVVEARDEAVRKLALAKTEWEQMLAGRDQALRDRDAAISTLNNAVVTEKQFRDEGGRILHELKKAEAREKEAMQKGEEVFGRLKQAEAENGRLKQAYEALQEELEVARDSYGDGSGIAADVSLAGPQEEGSTGQSEGGFSPIQPDPDSMVDETADQKRPAGIANHTSHIAGAQPTQDVDGQPTASDTTQQNSVAPGASFGFTIGTGQNEQHGHGTAEQSLPSTRGQSTLPNASHPSAYLALVPDVADDAEAQLVRDELEFFDPHAKERARQREKTDNARRPVREPARLSAKRPPERKILVPKSFMQERTCVNNHVFIGDDNQCPYCRMPPGPAPDDDPDL
ncbi:hypothetical protein LTR36_007476 [Oleoguttula mirabilis]|uniref:Uncharacterized protein n=1 Tax=Oleoguttula mirabilis TaxID=1507867 RepID=A0AAV9JAI9_9PEZI|nr:hypothetical protein LTR36_007476 [Oleoguttula mirabilis]